MTVVVARRSIAADPTSTALLLAGPSAVDLWPAARRLDEGRDGRYRLLIELPGHAAPVAVTLRASAPARRPTGFVWTLHLEPVGLPAATGTLTLRYSGDGPGMATEAQLRLEQADPDDQRGDTISLLQDADGLAQAFLGNLATAAESRSRAA
ncbi:MAG: hypothetical protein JWM67_852 [Mycobacterium sp.]|jgi:hypothetical protein|nr:hypothetical protein [Mycobacterium sp.]